MLRTILPVLLLLTALLQGCAEPDRLPAVPPELQGRVVVPGVPGVRYRADFATEQLAEEGEEVNQRELAWRSARGLTGPPPPAYFLVISGGGDNGAFGAGLLNGWTKAGTRPEFGFVTGISTGALIATTRDWGTSTGSI